MSSPRLPRSRLERVLGVFAEIKPGEGRFTIVLLLDIFLLLCAYYFVKPAREGWLATSMVWDLKKIVVRALSGFAQCLVLVGAIPLYAALGARVARRSLVSGAQVFFLITLVLFWFAQPGSVLGGLAWIGIAFYLWVGLFAVITVMQFWSLAADLSSDEQGRRLFPVIAVGAAAGSVVGAWAAGQLVRRQILSTYDLLAVGAVLLLGSTVLTCVATRRPIGDAFRATVAEPEAVKSRSYSLVFRHRLLLGAAAVAILVNWVNTNGENVLYGVVTSEIAANAQALELPTQAAIDRYVRDETTAFYGNLYFWVNLCGFLLQALVTSRLLRVGGFASIYLLLPVVSLLSYSAMLLIPGLAVIRLAKISENSTNYSVNNTARHVLWLPTTAEMKYNAKAVVDALCMRLGDALAALSVIVVVGHVGLPERWLLTFNLGLVILWGGAALVVVREHRRLSGSGTPPQGNISK